MQTGNTTNERQHLHRAIPIEVPGLSGQHAIDTWEDEGGAPARAPDGHDLAHMALADNAGWRASNNTGRRSDRYSDGLGKDIGALAIAAALADNDEEDQILRCLGAAVIARWNRLPPKFQREIFDNASAMGEVLKKDALKGRIARFLHKHKNDAG